MSNTRTYTPTANVVVMGPAGVGKTDLVHQWMNPEEPFLDNTPHTIGTSWKRKKYQDLDVNVWDIGGWSTYKPDDYEHYFKTAHVVLCCFDVESEDSLNEAITMLKTAFQGVPNRPYVVFVGTKYDTSDVQAVDALMPKILGAQKNLTTAIPGMNFHSRYVYTSAKEPGSNHYLNSEMDNFFNRTILSLCENELDRQAIAQREDSKTVLSGADLKSARTPSATYFQRHPNVRMGLAVAALVIGLAAIAVATVATCGVAGLLGAAAASIAATLTFGASLTTVGAVAGGVGLFGGLGVAAGSYLMHTRPRVEKVEVVQVHGSPFGGEKDKAAFGEALGDLKFAIKNNGAVRLFTGAMNRAGECLPFRGRSFSSSSGLDD